MKNSNEQKSNIVHRLINSTLKFKKELNDTQSKTSVRKFKYELPESFLKAVDNARITAGYDILPRRRHRSASPVIDQKTSSFDRSDNRDQIEPKITYSSSTNDIDRFSTKKVQFRRTPRRQIHHPQPRFFSPRPPFRMMMNPNFMLMNRSPRPANVLPIRMPQRPAIFRLRFRNTNF